ncbi:hypothetical protein Tco_0077603 [Tanacetum coccineum]
MAESSSLDITPKEEPVTLDRPESPNLSLPVTQVEFTFDEITFTPTMKFISLLLEHMAPKYDNEELTIHLTQVFSVHNWILKLNKPKEPPFTDHMKAICNLDVHVDSKAPKYSSLTEEVPQGKKPRARSGLRRKQSSKHTSKSTTEASKS